MKIPITSPSGREWEAETLHIAGDLAVIQEGVSEGEEWSAMGYGWNVTHIPTGLAAAMHFYQLESAITACTWLAQMADWSFSTQEEVDLAPYLKIVQEAKGRWADIGRPESRPDCYDYLDRDFDGTVIGADEEGVWVAHGDDYVEILSGYTYIDKDTTTDGCSYWMEREHTYSIQIGDCVFERGMPIGNPEVDPIPLNITEAEAEEWYGAYITEQLSICEECDLWICTDETDSCRIVDDCTLLCKDCFTTAEERGEICCHGMSSDGDCESCEREGDRIPEEEFCEGPQESSAVGYEREGDISLDLSVSLEEFKAELEKKLFPYMDREHQHEILSRRIESTLEEVK